MRRRTAKPTPTSAIPSPTAGSASNPVRGRLPSDDDVVADVVVGDVGGWLDSVDVTVVAVEAAGVPEPCAPEDEPELDEPELDEPELEDPELEEPDEPDLEDPEWLSGSVYCWSPAEGPVAAATPGPARAYLPRSQSVEKHIDDAQS